MPINHGCKERRWHARGHGEGGVGKFPAAMRESAKSSSDGFKEMSASLGAKRHSSVNAVGAVPVSESVSASMKARAKSVALKSSRSASRRVRGGGQGSG